MRSLWEGLKGLTRYKSAVIGLILIAALVSLAIHTVITIPYREAIRLWRGGENIWSENPKNAPPSWANLFSRINLPKTLVLSTKKGANKSVQPLQGETNRVKASLVFDYRYDGFPKELALFFDAIYKERNPYVSIYWLTPDGRKISLGERSVRRSERYAISLDKHLARKLGGLPPEVGLFTDPTVEELKPLKGTYELRVEGWLFEEGSDLDVKLVVYGQVHGLAGTDHRRRDIMVALLWGTPIALSFGILAAFGSVVSTLIIAAIGVWYGKWTDAVIQRLNEINMILPVLPILILFGTLYSRSIWVILGVLIALGIFSASLKTYRAMFLQEREAPYIEAARSYGAGGLRIIFRYMIPRAIPWLIPSFVILIPDYVFLEATLAVLGLGDPVLPTWGKLLNDAFTNGALYKGYYYWVVEPALVLMLTGFSFAMVGFALDRIFNPRLREL